MSFGDLSGGDYGDPPTSLQRVQHMKRCLDDIGSLLANRALADLGSSRRDLAALERSLENMSEASRYVPEAWKLHADPNIDWHHLSSLGDQLREPPYSLEPEVVWQLCKDRLSPIERSVDRMLAAYSPTPPAHPSA